MPDKPNIRIETSKSLSKKEREEEEKKQKPLLYYDVKVETLLPATLTFRVLAQDAHQASEKIKGMQPIAVHHKLIGRRDIKMTVYDAGSVMIRLVKKLIG